MPAFAGAINSFLAKNFKLEIYPGLAKSESIGKATGFLPKAVACGGLLGIMHAQKWGEGNKVQAILAKWLDWPPVWTLAGVIVIWLVSRLDPLSLFGRFAPGLALALFVHGLWLMAYAALQMWRARTTVNPRGQPSALVKDGIFGLSRNPIYLGDAFVLCAAAVWWDTALGLGVVAAFVWIVTRRFIKVEEGRLIAAFGEEAQEWFRQVRRWV